MGSNSIRRLATPTPTCQVSTSAKSAIAKLMSKDIELSYPDSRSTCMVGLNEG